MRWRGERQSSNIEDRRGIGGVGRVAVGGGLGTIVIMVLALLFGVDPQRLLEQVPSEQPPATQSSRPQNAARGRVETIRRGGAGEDRRRLERSVSTKRSSVSRTHTRAVYGSSALSVWNCRLGNWTILLSRR